MNNKNMKSLKEALSAFADGELVDGDLATEAEMLELACQHKDFIASWECMHLVRDVMQGDHCAALPSDFAARVSRSIAQESTTSNLGIMESYKVTLSAFADGELTGQDEAEVLEVACQDRDVRASWASAHLVRDVMQADYCPALPSDFAAKVSECIAQEEFSSDAELDAIKESLSAFADGEQGSQDDADVLEAAYQEQDVRSAWASAHLVRDVMQGDYRSALPANFAERVSASIEREKAHAFVSQGEKVNTSESTSPVVSMVQARDRISQRRNNRQNNQRITRAVPASQQPFTLWKPVAGLGLAASLAGATFLFSQLWETEKSVSSQIADAQQTDTSVLQGVDPTALASTRTEPANITDVESLTLQTAVSLAKGGTRWRNDEESSRNDAIEKRLNMLLTNHLEDASMGSVNGLISHSKVVGYDSMPEEQSE